MITRITRFSVRRPWLVIALWCVVVGVAAGVALPSLQARLVPATLFIPGTDSNDWNDLKQPNYGSAMAMALEGPHAALEAIGPSLNAALNSRPLTRVQSPWSPGAGAVAKILFPSPTEAVFTMDVRYPPGGNDSTIVPPLEKFLRGYVKPPVKFYLSGDAPLGRQLNDAGFEALHQGEILAAPLLVIVLLLVFGSPVAAALPLVIAGGTVGFSFGGLWVFSHFMGMAIMSLSLASMLGLALGVDYALLSIARFREALDDGLQPRAAATLAANTAGRTAVFAAFVLSALMLTVIILSPGAILQSASIGAMMSTIYAAISALTICPAAMVLLGHNINKWQLGGRGDPNKQTMISTIVRFFGRKPVVAAVGFLLLLLAMASPVLALKTTPADPHELPVGNPARFAYDQIRKAGLGPNVDIIIRDKNGGPITQAKTLSAISKLQDEIGRVPYVRFIAGAGILAPEAQQLLATPLQIKKAQRELAQAKTTLDQKAAQIQQGEAKVAAAKTKLASQLGHAQTILNQGKALMASVGGQIGTEFGQLVTGLGTAAAGAGALEQGTKTAKGGADLLANALAQIRDKVAQLQPVIQYADQEVRTAEASLSLLRVPTQATVQQIQEALTTLNTATVGQADPAVQAAKLHIANALADATGTGPIAGVAVPGYTGLDNSLAIAAEQARLAGNQVDSAVRQAGYAYDVMVQLADGASRLSNPALSSIISGLAQLSAGLTLAHDKVAAAEPQINSIQNQVSAALASGQQQLNNAGAQAFPQLQAAQDQLTQGLSQLNTVRSNLVSRSGPFKPLRQLDQIQQQSPFVFQSPYVLVSLLSGAQQNTRATVDTLIDSGTGGNVARIVMLPNAPTNSPAQDLVVTDTRSLVHHFLKQNPKLVAATGGSAAELLDFINTMKTSVPEIIVGLCLVTYLMLVPILRSIVLPAIAVSLNVLTVAVAMAVLTCFSVDGVISTPAPLGGPGRPDVLSITSVFCVIFALSIDYYVFLLLRMREEYVATQSNTEAVFFGIEKTGRIVTGAAAIMVGTFFAFALANFVIVSELGIGLTSAILVDATLVRLGLLPAVMRSFGDWTWYMPKWLDERLPTFDIEGSEFEHDASLQHGTPVHGGAFA
jgi:RND superfamily putative drug exporter